MLCVHLLSPPDDPPTHTFCPCRLPPAPPPLSSSSAPFLPFIARRDGEQHNLSWNCGAEGPTDSPAVNTLRQRQMRNMMTALLVAHGVPRIVMGDEYGHT